MVVAAVDIVLAAVEVVSISVVVAGAAAVMGVRIQQKRTYNLMIPMTAYVENCMSRKNMHCSDLSYQQ